AAIVSGWFNQLMAGFQTQNLDTARNELFPPDDPAQIWRSGNLVGTETLESAGMPHPTTYAGPVGQFIDPATGQMTTQGAERMDNPAMGFDTGGVGGVMRMYHGSPRALSRVELAESRQVGYTPPSKPQRPIEADYPNGVSLDPAGNLATSIEGVPLTAQNVAGRRA